jgi:dienelactone hydrolase
MRIIKIILISVVSIIIFLTLGLFLFLKFYTPALSENYGKVDYHLYVGDSDNQPLIVAFGGSQGGNTWTEDYWAVIRNRFLKKGYAVLSIGYFNTENTPAYCDRISLNAIYDTIRNVSLHPKINEDKIALLGSSRGGELALNIASKYKDIDAVVALVPSYASFMAQTITANTSAWTFNSEEVPYLPVPLKAIIPAIQGDSYRVCEIILENSESRKDAAIEVEKINGPILLLSAKNDELWPSKYMSDKVVNRLKDNNFKYYYKHISFDGRHHDTKKHFDVVFDFLDEHFRWD